MDDTPFVFDYTLFYQLSAMGLITTPINYYWQKWLEHLFPGEKLVHRTRTASSGDAEKGVSIRDDGEDKRAIGRLEEEVEAAVFILLPPRDGSTENAIAGWE